MGAEYLPYVKSIATFAPTFYGYIISVLASLLGVVIGDRKKQTDTGTQSIYYTLAKTEIIYPENVGAKVAMDFT